MTRRGKALGLWTALALVVGNMVGAGAYLVPSSLGAYGSVGLVGWLVTSYSAFAVVGAGWDAVVWGVVLMVMGLPVYRVGAWARAARSTVSAAESRASDG